MSKVGFDIRDEVYGGMRMRVKRDPLGSTQDVQSWISLGRFSTYNFRSEGSIIQKQTNDTVANPERNFFNVYF